MKAVLKFFISRQFLVMVGLVALALLIWFLGPMISIGGTEPLASAGRRWMIIGMLVGVWGLSQITSAVRSRARNRKLVEQLASGPEAEEDPAQAASEEELQALRERFDQALATLKRSEGKHKLGGRWVYQLPWYLIIGPPGCGKTTALVNSGLRFPLADELGQDAIHGIGGTRNCDWWFTDEAVLIDTAGRYTTQDSYEQVDKAAWRNFLELLKKHRPRRPINGVLVAVSFSDLMQQTQVERTAHAKAIRQRVQELCQTFGIAVPVYVLFMKADLVAGFTEFFGDLGKEAREQVWGTTFKLDQSERAKPAISAFPAELEALVERLDQRLLVRMEQEREPHKRALVFSFPRQLAELGEVLEQFLSDAFAPSRYEVRPQVRGVYFTSGTQTGTPIDRILGAYAANFGLGRQGALPFRGTGKSFFLTRLLRDVVFHEAGLAGLNLRMERRRVWLRRGAYASVAAIFLLTAAAWATSYSRNKHFIEEVEQRVLDIETRIDALPPEERNPLGVLPLLDAAREIPRGYAEREASVPLTMGLGLYQGDKLGSQAQRAYLRILNKALLPRVILRLEDQIRQAGGDSEYLYDALGVYLMLGSDEHYDAEAVQLWVGRDWQTSLPRETTTEQQESLRDHLAALLARRPTPLPLELDGALIADARDILNRTPLADRVYASLKRRGVGDDLPDFTVADAGGDFAKLVFVRSSGRPLNQGVPALYTYDGYYRGFADASTHIIEATAADSWILGPAARLEPDSEEARRLFEEVRRRYLNDYVIQWQRLLDDIDLVAVRDLQHAAEVARILADPSDSPLRRLLIAASQQTELDRKPEQAEEAAAGAAEEEGGLAGFRRRVDRYFESGATESAPAGEAPEAYVTRRFSWLHDLVRTNDRGQAPLDAVLETLSKLQLQLQSMAAAVSSGRAPLVSADSPEMREARALADRLPPVLGKWLGTLAQDTSNLSANRARALLNNIWTAEVLPFCREAINDRYPFVRGTERETTLFDFGRLLGPGGLMDAFFKANLMPLVDTARPTWRWVDENIGIPNETLAQFQRAATIREAFFMSGGKTPDVTFEVKPVSMDSRVTQFMLDLGGQIVDYRHGPPRGQTLKWPSPEGIDRVRLVFVDSTGSGPSLTEEGPWAWFRILDRSSFRPTRQPEKFNVTFSLGGLSARFELRAVSVRNPFKLDEVRAFRCPGRL
ncbi:type VI secretion system membrane subunit TssM [Thiorhodococcus minor]|uniref:Type VI secretion system membrane subunit TssM n=1 Tax=Thiorhodococcus minor TaxID=57489 RepID=A0A6M0K0P9_9GAMM|nr:type VI secretion system membrane subunit TssM [Thiorhodococcus minor]NEV63356.1 type VI secretion system membrane subunit TssM [Thiorhodococcus minor]